MTQPSPVLPRDFTLLVTAMRVDKLEMLLGKGNTLNHQRAIYASLINHEKRATFGGAGLILKFSADNVAGTSPTDTIGSPPPPWLNPSQTKARFADKYPMLTPAGLLEKTEMGNNEVVLVGTAPNGSEVSASGVFTTNFASSRDVEAFAAAARAWQLPLVQFGSQPLW